MKNILKIISLALAVFLFSVLFYLPTYIMSDSEVTPANTDGEDMTVMSANLRYIAYDDFFKRTWFYRADLIAEDINSVKPDIIGFQEVTFIHQSYLENLMVGYDFEIAYRDNFILSEGCPIFWRTDRYERIDSGSFWLSETPDVMSKDWGSEHYRICVYVILRDMRTDKQFVLFNTHLDNKSAEARINGIKVVLEKIKEFGDIPAFLVGDLNDDENSETIEFTKERFDDAMGISPITEDTYTYHNWGNPEKFNRIDYIMISKDTAHVLEYHVVSTLHGDVYSSDHNSIYIKVKLK